MTQKRKRPVIEDDPKQKLTKMKILFRKKITLEGKKIEIDALNLRIPKIEDV